MIQQPDKLFHEKLGSVQVQPPADAWNKIEANLDKKNKKFIWLKIAASLLLLAMASYLLWSVNHVTNTSQHTAQHNKSIVPLKPKKEVQPDSNSAVPENEVPPADLHTKHALIKSPTRNDSTYKTNLDAYTPDHTRAEHTATKSNLNVALKENRDSLNHHTVIENINPAVVASTEEVKNDNTITLVYTAEEINEKYLTKNSSAQATSEEKKPSTFKKLLHKAYDLKNNQDPFGELRQKKNEILALNFRKEKRGQNK